MRGYFLIVLLFLANPILAFQTESPSDKSISTKDPFPVLEAGLATEKNVPLPIYLLGEGRYQEALDSLKAKPGDRLYWLRGYLEGLIEVSKGLVRTESDHFILFTPPDQTFLKEYALPALEQVGAHLEGVFGHRPKGKILVEIYPTKEDFSKASTLSMETLKRSGAIGICKFHRLMVMSPRTLPLGYRWMDALSHEYMHLMINELTASKAELWLHEGTARYFETAFRADPPLFLSPHQKTTLLDAIEEDKLISFKRMSPSLVYLKDQDEVSLAFAQVSHAVSVLIRDHGQANFNKFFELLKKKPFPKAFKKIYSMTPLKFEQKWQKKLGQEDWEKTKGAMSDEVIFEPLKEEETIGANVKGKIRLGDRMRMRKRYKAALIEYKKALKEEPDNAFILLKAARTNLLMGKKEEAKKHLRRAIEKNPNYGTPHISLAKLVGGEEAISLLETANAINPFNPEIHLLWAKAAESMGNDALSKRERQIFEHLKN